MNAGRSGVLPRLSPLDIDGASGLAVVAPLFRRIGLMPFHSGIEEAVRVAAERIKQHVVGVGMADMIHQPFKHKNKLVGYGVRGSPFCKTIRIA